MRGAHHALAVGVVAVVGVLGSACDPGAAPAVDPDAVPLSAAERAALLALSPLTLPGPPPDVSNRFADDSRAAALGRKLFFETRFSGSLLDGDNDGSASALGTRGQAGKVACAGCHVARSGFLDDRTLGKQVSLAAGWGRRRAPSLLDMNSSRLYVAQRLFALYRAEYEAVFGAMPPLDDGGRFPPLDAEHTGCQPATVDPAPTCNGTKHGMPGDGAEFDGLTPEDQDAVTRVVVNMGKALGAYERLLTCGPGRFDGWIHGQKDALSVAEQRGAQLFVGRGQCASCHSGPFLSDQKFHNVGLRPAPVAVVFIDQDDTGAAGGLPSAIADPLNVRGAFSDGDDARLPSAVPPGLSGAFRTPILRCGARRPSFMHTGQLPKLADVVAFFGRGGDPSGYPGSNELTAVDLSAQDEQDLVVFLGTLEGPGPAADLLEGP